MKSIEPITLEILGTPLPWKAPFVSTRGTWSPRYQVSKVIKAEIARLYQGEVLDEAIRCDLTFYMPIPKATSKKKRLAMLAGDIRPEGTPDISNMRKYLEDLLQGIVIKNDCKIVSGDTSKYYSDNPRSVVRIYPI